MTIECLVPNEEMLSRIQSVFESKKQEVGEKFSVTLEERQRENLPILAIISTGGENKDCAKWLSDLNDELTSNIGDNMSVIRDDASAYYNSKLFSLVNHFERELRRYLHCKISSTSIDEAKKLTKELEKLDLGEVHERLFYDAQYSKDLQKKIGEEKPSRLELIRYLNDHIDGSLWGKLTPEKEVEVVRDRFLELKEYRNDVMHAHRMSYGRYVKAQELFSKVNEKLETVNEALLGNNPSPFQQLKNGASLLSEFIRISEQIDKMNIEKYKNAFEVFMNVLGEKVEESTTTKEAESPEPTTINE